MTRRQSIAVSAVILAIAFAPGASAQREGAPRHDARTDRLRGLSALELMVIGPHLDRGPVALVEFANKREDELPAINIAAYVNAPAADVVKVVNDPRRYPEFMRTIDQVDMVEQNGLATVYDWQWSLSIFRLRGRHSMTVYPPPEGRPSAGYRITVDSIGGDLGAGRFSLRVVPVEPSKSLLVLSIRLDMRRANYVVRQMARASHSINRSANISLAGSTLLSLRREAERQSGHVPSRNDAQPLRKPDLDTRRILPLLNRGDLVFFEMNGDRLEQVAVVGRIDFPRKIVQQVMTDTDAFGSALVPGSYAKVVAREKDATDFEWGVDLPLVGVTGRMRLSEKGPVVAVDAISGALSGGRWRFEASELSSRSSLVVGWTHFDMRNSTWLLEALIAADPYLAPGLTAAADIMLMRTLRSRARKRQLLLREQARDARAVADSR